MASNASNIRPKGQPQPFSSDNTPNIDANYGPWESQAEYLSYIGEHIGLTEDDILPGTIIAVYNTPESPETSGITRYIRENGAWRSLESGGSGGGIIHTLTTFTTRIPLVHSHK